MVQKHNPYPIQYVEPLVLPDGSVIQLRPIHEQDKEGVFSAGEKVSDQSLYQRFLGFVKIDDKMIERFTQLDYSKEMAIVAEVKNKEEKQIIAVARIAACKPNDKDAEFAIIVTDSWQGKGLGKIMTNYILNVAADLGYENIHAYLFSNNKAMARILTKIGFKFSKENEQIIKGQLELKQKSTSETGDWFHDFVNDIT